MEDAMQLIKDQLSDTGELAPVTPDVVQLFQLRITHATPLPPMEFLFRIFGTPCFPRGELVAVAGKAKSGKTFFLSLLMATALQGQVLTIGKQATQSLRVMWYDTEQSEQSTQEILTQRITPLLGDAPLPLLSDQLFAFNVRSVAWKERITLLEQGIRFLHPDLVVLDGVRDLVDDINNGVCAQMVVERLMRMASQNQCCIVCVLHQNKGADDRNMRGWIGTELMTKAFEVYACEKTMPGPIFCVEQTLTRKYDMPQLLCFSVNGQGLPVKSDPPADATKPTDRPPLNRTYIISKDNGFSIDLKSLFQQVLRNGPMYYTDLQTATMNELNCKDAHFWNKQFCMARQQGIIINSHNADGKSIWQLPLTPQ